LSSPNPSPSVATPTVIQALLSPCSMRTLQRFSYHCCRP
jgi:hypothetical protein